MSFSSLYYFPFLAILAILYHFLNARFHIIFLFLISWGAYALYGWKHFVVLAAITILSFIIGYMIEYRQKRTKKIVMTIGILCIIGILLVSKCGQMIFSENWILPIGISFYTFQALSYIIDVYHGENAEHNFIKYALYISFFPQLVAGPIEQASKLLPQLGNTKAMSEDIRVGMGYLVSGCVRKFVIADYLAVLVDRTYETVSAQSGMSLFIATVLFSFQIYGDFSGYTHIAIGSARLFGVHLTENFNQPYLATGCKDFWKRWHITLTQWFTKYIYVPLGGRQRKYRNILLVFLLSGFWHGADLTFLCWGAYFAIWRIVEEEINKVSSNWKKHGRRRYLENVKRLGTFLLVCFSWIFFRSQSMSEAVEVISKIFDFSSDMRMTVSMPELAGAGIRIGILALLPEALHIIKVGEADKKYYITAVLGILILISMLNSFYDGGISSFIYFQF